MYAFLISACVIGFTAMIVSGIVEGRDRISHRYKIKAAEEAKREDIRVA